MICPYCHNEMELGVIQSPNEISWKRKRSLIGTAEFDKDGVVLAERSFIKGSFVQAHLCRRCKKVIIDFG